MEETHIKKKANITKKGTPLITKKGTHPIIKTGKDKEFLNRTVKNIMRMRSTKESSINQADMHKNTNQGIKHKEVISKYSISNS